ncbi:hypothetical protein SISSUDRAFT_1041404 [Sistotremastrum suecicum HHB10207 ss-3]|uniref:Uncharacterized protein n=1 Tax=Sistotremastrum suecicum HHB10207 ss-3 TaxID=1314776 RepID=A0A166H8H3_9AGAM|nr:hypothetical protein SISSUDRAFT_1041404 [Sistotremastrum suecicum HHB10207 ss-3]
MEQLAKANQKAYSNPIYLGIWLAVSLAMVEYMRWWPDPIRGVWRFLQPIPAFASCAVPLMFFVDWFNRTYFEAEVTNVLSRTDLLEPHKFYSQDPASSLWVVEHKRLLIGVIAIDASEDAAITNLPTTIDLAASLKEESESPSSKAKSTKKKAPLPSQGSSTAIIRHFFMDESYRMAAVQDDLLAQALSQAFSAKRSTKLTHIQAIHSEFEKYVGTALRKAGFRVASEKPETLGFFRWRRYALELERENWVGWKAAEDVKST